MKLIIDIDEEYYNYAKQQVADGITNPFKIFIASGIPIPDNATNKKHQLIGRLKTERMSQAEFEQYAKEHGYIISTTNIIEQITAEIYEHFMTIDGGVHDASAIKCMEIIGKYK